MKKTILIIGTADTKSDELNYMKSCIERMGGIAPVMDVGVLGEPNFVVEYSKHDIAAAANTTNAAIIALGDENAAMTKLPKALVFGFKTLQKKAKSMAF